MDELHELFLDELKVHGQNNVGSVVRVMEKLSGSLPGFKWRTKANPNNPAEFESK